jgi:glycosyltransferase involved in cell wall biosynthesis
MIIYISSSYYPSVEANLVHVLNQVYSFKRMNYKIKLVLVSKLNRAQIIENIVSNYGLYFHSSDFIIFKSKSSRFKELKSFLVGFFYVCYNFNKVDFIISRNLFFSFFFKCPNLISEFHTLYNTKLRGYFQRKIINRKYQKNIFISRRLYYYLSLKQDISNYLILHDAAVDSEEICTLSNIDRKYVSSFFLKEQFLCLYSGSLHKGRGIELIVDLANQNPEINFLVIGQLNSSYSFVNSGNIYFLGYVPYIEISSYLKASDVLLMPYQNKVSINVKGQDTSKWMSPLKLFEYMSVNKPILSSNLPVLREVLRSNYNCKLVKYNSVSDWNCALNLLKNNAEFSKELSNNAYLDFKTNYTWDIRAMKIYNYFYEK